MERRTIQLANSINGVLVTAAGDWN